jgi:hypothetical protein
MRAHERFIADSQLRAKNNFLLFWMLDKTAPARYHYARRAGPARVDANNARTRCVQPAQGEPPDRAEPKM